MSIALGQMEERQGLQFDDPVAKYLPAFAANGKEGITIAHCLTHTAGLWNTMQGKRFSVEETVTRICRQRVFDDWVPGQRCGYDSPAWYVLAGLVAAADQAGRPYERYTQDEIFGPLGLGTSSVGMEPERHATLKASGLLAPIYVAPRLRTYWKPVPGEDDPQEVMYPCPAGNGRGPAKDLAALYASLLPQAGCRVLSQTTVERISAVAREGLTDELQGVDTAWSLGFAVRSVLSGRHASPSAFGHGGSQSSWAFADPEHGLAAACLCNGKPGPELHYRRVGAVSTALYEDLDLASEDTAERSFRLPSGMGTF
jgi:CubicO group peptidase (beta-lactamase class C family)